MNERQEPIPGWAKPLLWVNDTLIFDAPWTAFREQSGLVIPLALLNGRAWKGLIGRQGAGADAGASGLGGEAR